MGARPHPRLTVNSTTVELHENHESHTDAKLVDSSSNGESIVKLRDAAVQVRLIDAAARKYLCPPMLLTAKGVWEAIDAELPPPRTHGGRERILEEFEKATRAQNNYIMMILLYIDCKRRSALCGTKRGHRKQGLHVMSSKNIKITKTHLQS